MTTKPFWLQGGTSPLPMSKTLLETFQRCPRECYYRYCEGLEQRSVDQVLIRGSVWGEAMAAYWLEPVRRLAAAWLAVSSSKYYSTISSDNLTIIHAGLDVYDEVYKSTTPVATEVEPTLIGALNDNAYSKLRADILVEPENKGPVLVEVKTTEHDLSEDGWYWEKLAFDAQPAGYWNAYSGYRIVYDVFRFPKLTRELATPPAKREFYKRGSKDGSAGPGAPKPGTRLHDETQEQFFTRALEYLRTHRFSHFRRQEVTASDSAKQALFSDLRSWARQITSAGEYDEWPRKNSACRRGQRMCAYYQLCYRDPSVPEVAVKNLYTKREDR